ncbi:kinesin-domain-containing protein [Testicularia cyperi]|uniref:Kinesin-domain-containing protein n=1 Tax=Testicularia cyperi TaxID=1882483 RepID=A0A317XT77_9BASI|nr:kinesin-domain-containing protein [Testicularia cyperi]
MFRFRSATSASNSAGSVGANSCPSSPNVSSTSSILSLLRAQSRSLAECPAELPEAALHAIDPCLPESAPSSASCLPSPPPKSSSTTAISIPTSAFDSNSSLDTITKPQADTSKQAEDSATATTSPTSSTSSTRSPSRQTESRSISPAKLKASPRRTVPVASSAVSAQRGSAGRVSSHIKADLTAKNDPSDTPIKRKSLAPRQASLASAGMGKKAKIGAAGKSSPFTKPPVSSATSKDAANKDATNVHPSTEEEPNSASLDDAASTDPVSDKTVELASGGAAISSTSASASSPSTMSSTLSDSRQNVVVCVRMRPLRSKQGTEDTSGEIWNCDKTKNQIVPTDLHPAIAKRTTSSERAGASMPTMLSTNDLDGDEGGPGKTYMFQFDKLIGDGDHTCDMYASHIGPVVRAAMEGYNGTVFAYGQTGSGKTHTMSGSADEPGVIPSAVHQVFRMIREEPSREYLLRVSYLEIYNETLKDLLAPLPATVSLAPGVSGSDRPASPTKGGSSHSSGQSQSSTLRIVEDPKQNRVMITGLREEIVTDAEAVLDLIQRGQDERHVGATDWNERSSRSHCVFQLTIESRSRSPSEQDGKEVRVSQLNLIDLAGSERAASQAERRKEGAFINKSLLTLGTVIGKLTEQSADSESTHIPYRDSKLTRILQTSLSGNARIAVICTLSPDREHANETLSTLKFGKRCKMVVTTAKRGTAMDDKALLQKYRKELDALRARLEANTATSPNPEATPAAGPPAVDPAVSAESQQKLDELNLQREEAQKEVEQMQQKRSTLKGQIDHLTRLILTSQSVANDSAPGTPVRRSVHAPALARRGPRMSDLHAFASHGYGSPAPGAGTFGGAADASVAGTPILGGPKPFELEAELAGLRRQLREQIESRQSLVAAHKAELAARDARESELQEAIRLNEQELDEAETAYDKLRDERDEARKIALKEQEKARENRKRLLEEQEANRLLKLVAKARAGEEDAAMQSRIEGLQNQLQAKRAEADEQRQQLQSELDKARSELENEKAARQRAEATVEAANKASQDALAELEQIRLDSSSSKATADQEEDAEADDVEAEFKDIVSGKSGKRAAEDQSKEWLKQREFELDAREKQLHDLRVELETSRTELQRQKQDEAAQRLQNEESSAAQDKTARELASLRDELGESEEAKRNLEIEMARLRATVSGRQAEKDRIEALDAELRTAKAKIEELQTEIRAEKARTLQALNTVARPLPVPSQDGGLAPSVGQGRAFGGSVPSSPVKGITASRLRGGSLFEGPSTPTRSSPGLNRAGSVKEYRRYTPSATINEPASPSPAATGTRSVLLGHRATFDNNRNASVANNRAEKEEIERLNAVINSQRALMADLENSVASWKMRMKQQAELIQKLVQQQPQLNSTSSAAGEQRVATAALDLGSGGHSPPCSDGESDVFGLHKQGILGDIANGSDGRGRWNSPRTKPPATGASPERGFGTLPRTTHLSLGSKVEEPYYGAHTYNRPPLNPAQIPGSPYKPYGHAGLPSSPYAAGAPTPLPLPSLGVADASENRRSSPSPRKPRKTIESDLRLLKASPRVETNKSKFITDLLASTPDTPSRRRTNASAYYI